MIQRQLWENLFFHHRILKDNAYGGSSFVPFFSGKSCYFSKRFSVFISIDDRSSYFCKELVAMETLNYDETMTQFFPLGVKVQLFSFFPRSRISEKHRPHCTHAFTDYKKKYLLCVEIIIPLKLNPFCKQKIWCGTQTTFS